MESQSITTSSGSDLSRLSQRQRRHAPEMLEIKERTIIIGNWLSRSVWMIVTLGLCRVFYKTWRLAPTTTRDISEGLSFPANTNNRSSQWKHILGKLNAEWKQIYLGCALILSLSVALLQIDLVLQSVIGRTTAIMTFLLSGAGLMLSAIFRLVIHQHRDEKYPNQWVKASKAFNSFESVQFWSLLALPLSLLIWSVILCVITVLSLPCAVQLGGGGGDSAGTKLVNIISTAFLMTLTVMIIGLVYRAINFARGLC